MNWYKQAMPLPEIGNKYPTKDPKDILTNLLDEKMTNETKEKIDMEDRSRDYLDVGTQGVVYDIGGDAVEKITADEREFDVAETVMELQKEQGKLPFVVGVYYADKVQEDPALYRIVMEKVTTLSEEEQKVFRANFNEMHVTEHLRSFTGNDFLDGMLEFIRHLKEYEFWPSDMAPYNVGRRADGGFVVLDLGAIQKINTGGSSSWNEDAVNILGNF